MRRVREQASAKVAKCESRQEQKQPIVREAKRERKAAKEASRAGNRVAVAQAARSVLICSFKITYEQFCSAKV